MVRTPAARPAVALVLAGTLGATAAGCGAIKSKEEASAVVARRAVGMRAGEFFDAFGPARTRTEALDGTTVYRWQSTVGAMPPGPQSLDERVCNLVVTADKGGRITAVDVVRDTQGRTSASRCGEIFR